MTLRVDFRFEMALPKDRQDIPSLCYSSEEVDEDEQQYQMSGGEESLRQSEIKETFKFINLE